MICWERYILFNDRWCGFNFIADPATWLSPFISVSRICHTHAWRMGLSFVVSLNVLINTQLHTVADKWLCHVMQCIIYLLSCNVLDRLSKIIWWVRLSLLNRVVSCHTPPPPLNLLYSQGGTTCQIRPKMSQSNLWLNLYGEVYYLLNLWNQLKHLACCYRDKAMGWKVQRLQLQ
jgi:hypothetical protein